MPALLANTLVPWFAKPTRVTTIESLAPRLRRVRFVGDALKGAHFEPGHEVEFRVGPTAFRHYTPTHVDVATGALEVVFFLHGQGPGSAWAEALQPGALVDILGPGGRFVLNREAQHHVLLGDETCLGLFVALLRALPPSANVSGAVEVSPGAEDWPGLVGLPLTAVPRTGPTPRGMALLTWLESSGLEGSTGTTAYLSGHAGSIVMLRKELLERRGFAKRDVRSKAYWADGKRGL
ncbi:siderophore-interacting protein [Myxococcus hansupus]|nr:siderophore-interacting protein [Myxococcus hansupus]